MLIVFRFVFCRLCIFIIIIIYFVLEVNIIYNHTITILLYAIRKREKYKTWELKIEKWKVYLICTPYLSFCQCPQYWTSSSTASISRVWLIMSLKCDLYEKLHLYYRKCVCLWYSAIRLVQNRSNAFLYLIFYEGFIFVN